MHAAAVPNLAPSSPRLSARTKATASPTTAMMELIATPAASARAASSFEAHGKAPGIATNAVQVAINATVIRLTPADLSWRADGSP